VRSVPQDCSPKHCMHFCSSSYVPHAPPGSTVLILPPEYFVRNTDHEASHDACYLFQSQLRLYYILKPPILKYLQPMFLPQYKRPSFTPIQNNVQNHSFVYFENWKTKDSRPNDSVTKYVRYNGIGSSEK
jgi:hypothetical protein